MRLGGVGLGLGGVEGLLRLSGACGQQRETAAAAIFSCRENATSVARLRRIRKRLVLGGAIVAAVVFASPIAASESKTTVKVQLKEFKVLRAPPRHNTGLSRSR